jgi:sugar O-acyltransferase (sialic acid O-acetyltransferase NeuD family)
MSPGASDVVVLFGAGSTICADVAESCRRRGRPIAAAIRNVAGPVYAGEGVPVLEADDVTAEIAGLPFLLPLFSPGNRRIAFAAATAHGFRQPARLIDPTAIVASDCAIEDGVYVNAGCIIGSASSLGRFAFCNRGANIGHHCRIGAFASIGPGAVVSGMATVGDDSQVGSGAIILREVRIGVGALIAPGAVVARDVPDNGFAAGNPARILTRRPAKD